MRIAQQGAETLTGAPAAAVGLFQQRPRSDRFTLQV